MSASWSVASTAKRARVVGMVRHASAAGGLQLFESRRRQQGAANPGPGKLGGRGIDRRTVESAFEAIPGGGRDRSAGQLLEPAASRLEQLTQPLDAPRAEREVRLEHGALDRPQLTGGVEREPLRIGMERRLHRLGLESGLGHVEAPPSASRRCRSPALIRDLRVPSGTSSAVAASS